MSINQPFSRNGLVQTATVDREAHASPSANLRQTATGLSHIERLRRPFYASQRETFPIPIHKMGRQIIIWIVPAIQPNQGGHLLIRLGVDHSNQESCEGSLAAAGWPGHGRHKPRRRSRSGKQRSRQRVVELLDLRPDDLKLRIGLIQMQLGAGQPFPSTCSHPSLSHLSGLSHAP